MVLGDGRVGKGPLGMSWRAGTGEAPRDPQRVAALPPRQGHPWHVCGTGTQSPAYLDGAEGREQDGSRRLLPGIHHNRQPNILCFSPLTILHFLSGEVKHSRSGGSFPRAGPSQSPLPHSAPPGRQEPTATGGASSLWDDSAKGSEHVPLAGTWSRVLGDVPKPACVGGWASTPT